MAIYLAYLFIVGVQSWHVSKRGCLNDTKGKAYYVALCCAEMILIAALRGYQVGADTGRYLDALEYYGSLPKNEILSAELVRPFVFEKGYFFLTKLCAWLGVSNSVFLLVVALLIYIPVFFSIYRYSKIPFISILAYFAIGFFSYSLGIFRQMIAISIVICGLEFIVRKKPVLYFLFVAAASLFHTTALAAVALYVVYHIPIRKFWKWIIPAETICLLFGRQIVLLLVKVFPRYSGYLGGRYDIQSGTYLMLLFLNVLLFAMLYLHQRGFTQNQMTIAALSLAVMIQSVSYSMALVGRAVTYFSFFSIFACSEIVYVFTNNQGVYESLEKDFCRIVPVPKGAGKRIYPYIRVIAWVGFVVGLGGLALKDLVGNNHILPYTFFFMQ